MVTSEKSVSGILETTKMLMEQEENLRQKKRVLGFAVPAVIIVIFIVFYLLFSSTIAGFDQDKFFARLERNIVMVYPDVGKELARVGEKLFPLYLQELEKAADQSVYLLETRFVSEMEKLQKNIEAKIAADSAATLLKVSAEQRIILLREIPQLNNDPESAEKLLVVLNNAMLGWIQDLFTKALQDHAMALIDLKKTLDRSYKLEGKDKESIDTERVLTLWLEFMNESLAGEPTIIKPAKN
jgi:hypothetical protein